VSLESETIRHPTAKTRIGNDCYEQYKLPPTVKQDLLVPLTVLQ